MRGIGLRPYGMLSLSDMGAAGAAASGLNPFIFNLGDSTFTAAMAIRNVNFYGPIIQGDWDGTGQPDLVTLPRGALLGNQTQFRYANFDPYQGSIVLLLTPEWDGDDGISHGIFGDYFDAPISIFKRFDDILFLTHDTDTLASVNVAAWVAGTTYCVVFRWDSFNTLDGTNHGCVSPSDVHTYGEASSWAAVEPPALQYVGTMTTGTESSADSVIELLHIFNRPLFDGVNGVDVGNGDEIALIYGGGTFVDPMIITKGIGAVMGIPTDCGTAFDTGPDHAWAWPRASNIPDVYDMWDGGLPGTPYAVEFDGTSTYIDCGSDASLDDLPSGAILTVAAWIRVNDTGVSQVIVGKNPSDAAGWRLFVNSDGQAAFKVECATTDAIAYSSAINVVPYDGKWHYVVGYFIDATKAIDVSVDGRWGSNHAGSITVGVGAYQADAAGTMYVGRFGWWAGGYIEGGVAWIELSDNDRHVAGTDFIPPRYPYEDGNTIEDWRMDEGTGATAAAQVAGANDGTITSGSWSSIWNIVGTPVIPQSLQFFQENDGIDFGSGANIDDLPSADCTIEFWARIPVDVTNLTYFFTKANDAATLGWLVNYVTNKVRLTIVHATNNAVVDCNVPGDGLWHHYAFDWDFGTLTLRAFCDGILDETDTGVGAYQADAAADCLVNARNAIGAGDGAWAIGWLRLSDSRRYTGTSFVPDDRVNPPGNDANAQLLVNMTDGAGTTATDTSGNGYNGTITFGATTRWNNTPDMTIDESGARLNPNGYNVGSDAADDGIGTTEVVTAETDYAVFGMVNVGADGHGWPYLYVYDNTGAAQIGANFYLPRMTDLHTGANNSATLINANGHFTQHLVGATLYNITDGSSTTITAVSGDNTTITGVLAGGTDNDWDTNDVYLIRFARHYSRHPFGVDFNFVFRTPAACVSVDIEIRNEEGAGVIAVHSLQVLESVTDGGSFEGAFVGAAPPIPALWANDGLDAGECQAGAVVHSGTQSLQYNAGASNFEGVRQSTTDETIPGNYYYAAMWAYSEGDMSPRKVFAAARMPIQYDPSVDIDGFNAVGAWWELNAHLGRWVGASDLAYILGHSDIGAACYADDYALIEMDSITLTCTPANQANSLEGSGIRVDGLDTLTQPIPVGVLTALEGIVTWTWTPRHDDTESIEFGNALPTIMICWGDATNYFYVSWSAADTMTLGFDAAGAGFASANWATGGGFFTPGTDYSFRVVYTPLWMRLDVDGVTRITVVSATGFTTIPTICYWGTSAVGLTQVDAVYS